MTSSLTIRQIYDLAIGAGLTPDAAVTATAVSLAESSGNPANVGDVGLETSTWGPSVGLWQVRSVKAETGKGTTRDVSHLTDPTYNAQSMATISAHGTNWEPWTTYTNGAYRGFLPSVYKALGINAGQQPPASAGTSGMPAGSTGSTGSTDAAGAAAGAASSAAIDTSGTFGGIVAFGTKAVFVVLGLGLIGMAAYQAVKPEVARVENVGAQAAQAAPLAAL